MADLRLFVAIELPSEVRSVLQKLQHDLQRDAALARLRWVRPEGIHLTLKFLGAVPEEKRGEIEAAVRRAAEGVAPFGVRLGKMGTFGSKRAPRVLWVDVAGDTEALGRLQSQVERELAPLGFPAEARAFSPHLTLARVPPERASEAAGALSDVVANREPPRGTIPATEVALMKSDLRRDGAVYTQLFAAPLEE
jgi:2'-5' RNA ligase